MFENILLTEHGFKIPLSVVCGKLVRVFDGKFTKYLRFARDDLEKSIN